MKHCESASLSLLVPQDGHLIRLGAFGEVRMCVHRDSGSQRAVKVLRKSQMDSEEEKMLFNEINILKQLVRNAS